MPGIIPEGLTMIAGAPKIGKSWLALNVAAAVSTGDFIFDYVNVPHLPCLYISFEDNLRRLQKRMIMINATPSKHLRIATDWRCGANGLTDLKKHLVAYPETRLIIIDTFARFRGLISTTA